MNCRPPRPMFASRFAEPAPAKARSRNRDKWNIGSGTRFSIHTKATSRTTPPISSPSTTGLAHPIVCVP